MSYLLEFVIVGALAFLAGAIFKPTVGGRLARALDWLRARVT